MPTAIDIFGRDEAGIARALYASTGRGFVTAPTDFPANTIYRPRVVQPGNWRRSLWSPGSTFGRSEVGYGIVEFNNADGYYDVLQRWALDKGRIVIRRGSKGAAFPNAWTTVLVATIDGHEFTQRTVKFHLRDRQAEVADVVLNEETFAGDNVLPDGYEGTDDDIAGRNKPIGYGKIRNGKLIIVNTSKLIAQTRLRGNLALSTSAVYSRGSPVNGGSDYPDLETLASTAPAAGEQRAYEGTALLGAYVRFETEPEQEATFDMTVGATSERTANGVMQQVLQDAGVPSAEILSSSILDATVPYEIGYHSADQEARAGELLDRAAASIHGWWNVDRLGRFTIGRLLDPAQGTSVATFTRAHLLDPANALNIVTGVQGGIPVGRVIVKGQRNWTVQKPEALATGLTLEDIAWRGVESRQVVRESPTVQARHPFYRTLEVDTLLDSLDDMAALADYLLTLYGVRRDVYEIKVRATHASDVDLGDVVTLTFPRFDLTAGKKLRVIGIDEDLKTNNATLTLWG